MTVTNGIWETLCDKCCHSHSDLSFRGAMIRQFVQVFVKKLCEVFSHPVATVLVKFQTGSFVGQKLSKAF